MSVEAWFTLAVIIAAVAAMATNRIGPHFAIPGAVLILLLTGIINEDQALSGFSNPAPATIAALYILARGVEVTGALDGFGNRMFSNDPPPATRASLSRDYLRILLPVGAVSGFINNTPLVAILATRTLQWARRTGRHPGRYLMPLSFAAILGGLTTTIGTSTNLVVSGLLQNQGMEPLKLFEVSKLGVPVAVAGIVILLVAAPFMTPIRRTPFGKLEHSSRRFTVEMIVSQGGSLKGKTVAEAGLRNLEAVFLVEIERSERTITPVGPNQLLEEEDRLVFAGDVKRILDLMRIGGLAAAEERHFSLEETADRRFFEAVVAGGSILEGNTLKEVAFRSKYGAAVLAIHRAGSALGTKLGEARLRAGDVLLLLSDRGFRQRWGEQHDFLLISPVADIRPVRSNRASFVRLVFVGLLAAVAGGLVSVLQGAVVAAGLLVATRTVNVREARSAVDFKIIMIIAASFGLGAAIVTTGLASEIVAGVIALFGQVGGTGLLAGTLVATVILTALISNTAAAVIMFPIALSAAVQAGVEPRPFAIAVMLGASIDFMTPIGYQTNTMVYGMGSYRFLDFSRLGAPITAAGIILGVILIPLFWPLN